jgi:phage terminase large subunit
MPENQTFQFRDTKATQKIFELKKRIRAICGGTSASKTISILVWLIDYAQTNKNKKIDIISESIPHLDDGAIKDFKGIMMDRGYWNDDKWNSTLRIYDFGRGTVIKFKSVDKLGKSRGPRRDVLFLNECNNISYEIADQLIVRTSDVIWLDWNPTNEFWFYTEIKDKRDCDFITLTYADCVDPDTGKSVLPPSIIEDIESHKHNKNWWSVYGLGQLGELEGKIYNDWQFIDEIPHEARLERRGLDFGYSIDPTVIVDIYSYNGGYIIDELLYQKGLSNKSIADVLLMDGLGSVLVVADSAEPKSIDEIRGYGVNIIGAVKGKDSVNQGIQFVQDQRISLTNRSVRTVKAYRNYIFMTDKKTGKVINTPDDTIHEWSNSMDAIRYGLDSYRPRTTKSNIYVPIMDTN